MWFGRWLFVSLFLCAVLGMLHAALAMGETIERAELKLMPARTAPVARTASFWEPPSERLAAAFDEYLSLHGEEALRELIRQNFVRTGLYKIEG